MPRLLDYFAPAYAWLYALDPAFPQALFVSLVFFTVWLLRKLAPNQWERFANLIYVKTADLAWWQNEIRVAWQALPAAIIGTLYGILGTGADPGPTLKAMALSLIAPVAHRLMARYEGQIGKSKTPGGSGGKPVGNAGEARDMTDVATPPESAHAPITALQRRRRAPRLAWAFALLALLGCSPSMWQAQRETANVVAEISSKTVLPALTAAYDATGTAAVSAEPTRAAAQQALIAHQAKWKPVWDAWSVFQAAHNSWQDAIDAQGDPLPSAIAARTAYCRLRRVTTDLGVKLPELPLGGCS